MTPEALDKEKLMLDRFAGPVLSVEDLQNVYGRLGPEDQSKLIETLSVAKERFLKKEIDSATVPGSFGSLVTISSDGIEIEIPLLPGILTVKISQKDLEDLWHWILGN